VRNVQGGAMTHCLGAPEPPGVAAIPAVSMPRAA